MIVKNMRSEEINILKKQIAMDEVFIASRIKSKEQSEKELEAILKENDSDFVEITIDEIVSYSNEKLKEVLFGIDLKKLDSNELSILEEKINSFDRETKKEFLIFLIDNSVTENSIPFSSLFISNKEIVLEIREENKK